MTKKLFMIVAMAWAFLLAGSMIAGAVNVHTLNGTWAGQLSHVGPNLASPCGPHCYPASVDVFPLTVTLTTNGAGHISGTLTSGTSVTGTIDGHAITNIVYFMRFVVHDPNASCPDGIIPADELVQGIASIDPNTPTVLIITSSGNNFCGFGMFNTVNLNKQP